MDLFDGPDDFLQDADDAPVVPPELAPLLADLHATDSRRQLAAIAEIQKQGHAQLQEHVARALLANAEGLGFDGVTAALDCLDALGDGRCVRTMEAVLHDEREHLTEHQAWRARHIIQRIRRFGRK